MATKQAAGPWGRQLNLEIEDLQEPYLRQELPGFLLACPCFWGPKYVPTISTLEPIEYLALAYFWLFGFQAKVILAS